MLRCRVQQVEGLKHMFLVKKKRSCCSVTSVSNYKHLECWDLNRRVSSDGSHESHQHQPLDYDIYDNRKSLLRIK